MRIWLPAFHSQRQSFAVGDAGIHQPSPGIRNKLIILNILPINPPAITKRVCFPALYFQMRENSAKLFLDSSLPEQERGWGSREERIAITALRNLPYWPACGFLSYLGGAFTNGDEAKSNYVWNSTGVLSLHQGWLYLCNHFIWRGQLVKSTD